MRVEVTVRGVPAPQGSKRHVGSGRMIEQSRAVGPWREAVRAETQRTMEHVAILDGPVTLTVTFRLPRPKTVKAAWPGKRPDLDKLCRAVLDGLTDGGAWHDDGQVVVIRAAKFYARDGFPPGCVLTIDQLKEEPAC